MNHSNKKILVIGSPGSGKSTLTKQLSEISGIPAIHLDSLYWHQGWVETPRPLWTKIVQEKTAGDSWIMDGNFSSTFDIRLPHADIIVFLDLPRWLCLARIVKRVITSYGKVRSDMGRGCPEKWDNEFVQYVWNFNRNERPKNITKLREYQKGKTIITLRTSKEIRCFLGNFATTFL